MIRVNKVRTTAQDPDIVVDAETLTLKDPNSIIRIDLACKSRHCLHTACFDLSTFLNVNEQVPTWSCPICSCPISTDDDLVLDGYVQDILYNTNQFVESVIIYSDGTWSYKNT
jgi:E3 SUMO-protein ligase PIAS1